MGSGGESDGGFEVHATPYGRVAADLLAAQIVATKAGDPLAPVTVLVPSNYAAVSTRRSLAGRSGGLANVTFLTLFRLAERLGGRSLAAAGRRPVSAPVILQAVREVLESDPGVFAPVARHPATELSLVAATRELAAVTPASLDAVASCSERASDVVRVARTVRTRLAADWFDEQDLLQSARSAVVASHDAGPVVAHLLQDVSPAGADLLRALASRRTVRVHVGLTGDDAADRHVLDAHARMGVKAGLLQVEPSPAARIVSVSDPDEEVRASVRIITGWMRDGVRLAGIAVLYAGADPYARVLDEQLEAAGVPHNGAPVRSIGDMLLGRTFRAMLALPERRFRRSDVLAVVTGAPMLDVDGLAPGRAWERISRLAGVVDGDDWDSRLSIFSSEQRLLADEADRTELEPRANHLRRDADRADHLAAFVGRLRSELGSLTSATSWADMAAAAARLLDEYLGGARSRWRWSDEERRAADRVEEALERLGGLDPVGGPRPTVDAFRRALDGELEATLGRMGRLGEGVLVGPVSMAIGLEMDRVIVLGMAEGSFPATRLDDSLLPDDEREAASGELSLRRDKVHDDHRHLLATVASAREAVLVFPRGDLRRSGDRSASRWLLADAARLAGRESIFTADLATLSSGWLTTVPSFAAGVAATTFPATAQDLRLATMLTDVSRVVETDAWVRRGMEMARARRSGEFTRFDGNLAGCDLPDYAGTDASPTSATRLQAWVECPHAFFLQYLLRVEAVDDPERRFDMSPLEKGSLIHEILDRFIHERIRAGEAGPWTGAAMERLEAIADQVCRSYEDRGLTGRSLFWRRDRAQIMADLTRFATVDTGRPMHTELRFDDARYPLPDGRSVRFRGVIDRLDRLDSGAVSVIDYKTGKPYDYRGLDASNPHDDGRHLQLAIYGVAAQQIFGEPDVDAGYWFVTDRGRFQRIGYDITDAVRDDLGAVLATIVDSIRNGVFPLRPSAKPSYLWVDCWYCAPDGLSTAEARRDWELKRLDPSLREYVALVEPEAIVATA